MSKTVVIAAVCLLLAGSVATAATLEESGSGGLLNGAAPGAVPAQLQVGDRVTGPAVVRSAAGDTLTVPSGTVIELVVPGNLPELEEGAPPMEHFLLVRGALLGEISYATTVILPNGCYFTGPKDEKASVYVETIDATHGFFRVNEGRALVSYRDVFTAILMERQGIELFQVEKGPMDLGFRTHQSNSGSVQLFIRPGRVEIETSLPKATSGLVTQEQGGTFTRVESDASSWQGGKIGITTRASGEMDSALQTGQLGPSTYALINNETGEIQFGFIEVDFEIVERAISLTSEFSVLAVSNFFGLK